MMNFNPQQPPGPFPFLDEIEQRVHPVTNYVLAGVGTVGGYWYGIEHDTHFPVVVFVGLGLICGLLAVVLLKHLAIFLIGGSLVAAATLGAWWLLGNDAVLRHPHTAPATQAAPVSPADTSRGLLDDLRKAVQP